MELVKYTASNSAISNDMDSASIVSSLTGLDRAFQKLGEDGAIKIKIEPLDE